MSEIPSFHPSYSGTGTAKSSGKFRLIAGMPRAGTTALTRALNTGGAVAAFGETCFWGNSWVEPQNGVYGEAEIAAVKSKLTRNTLAPFDAKTGGLDASLPSVRSAIFDALDALPLPTKPQDAFTAIGSAVAQICGRDGFVEKTPHHIRHLDRIMQAAPDSRVLILLRKPEEFLLSYKHQGDRKPPGTREEFQDTYHPAAAAMVCRGCLKSANEAVRHYGDAVKVIWLHDLEGDPGTVLPQVAEHLQIEDAVNPLHMVQDNSSFEGRQTLPELLDEDLAWLHLLAGGEIKRAGLPSALPNGSGTKLAQSALGLPAWAFRLFKVHGGDKARFKSLITRWIG